MPPWFWKLVQDIAPAVLIALGGWVYGLARRLKAEREAKRRIELPPDKKEYLRRKACRITDELNEAQGHDKLRRSTERGADLRAITIALGREEATALREAIRKG